MVLTEEQKNVVNALQSYDRVKIMALAGTGKTTTLKAIAEHYHDKRILFLAFNHSVKVECEKKFPQNTSVYTIHGLAFKYYKDIYKASPKAFNLSVYTLEDHIKHFNFKRDFGKNFVKLITERRKLDYEISRNLFHLTSLLKSIYEDYLYSDVEDLREYIKISEHYDYVLNIGIDYGMREVEDVYEILKQIYDLQIQNTLPVSHDVYVKWFANSLPHIFRERYDIVCLDEAQDTNAVSEQILEKLPIKKKIIVGDIHQKIYGFRKAVAVIDLWQADITLPLTTTFRCPHDVCEYANRILECKNSDLFLKSYKKQANNECKDTAYLTRTNSSLIEIMLMLIEKGMMYKVIRDIDEIFKLPMAIEDYFNGFKDEAKRVYPVFKENFRDMEALKEYAEKNEDVELLYGIRIVEKINRRRMNVREAYELCKNNIDKKADIVLATAHSSKGLEWDMVYIWSDFPYLPRVMANAMKHFKVETIDDVLSLYKKLMNDVYRKKEYEKRKALDILTEAIEEVNLYYVAITRAREKLEDYSENVLIRDKEDLEQKTKNELIFAFR